MIQLWRKLELGLVGIAGQHDLLGQRRPTLDAVLFLNGASILEDDEVLEIRDLQQLRNKIVHGEQDHREALTDEVMDKLLYYATRYGQQDPEEPAAPV